MDENIHEESERKRAQKIAALNNTVRKTTKVRATLRERVEKFYLCDIGIRLAQTE